MSKKIKLSIGLLIAIIVLGGVWLYIANVKVGADTLKSKIKEPNNKASLKINPNSAGELALIIKMPDKYTKEELSDAFIGKKTRDANDKSEEINTLKSQLVKDAAQKRYDEIMKSDAVFQNEAKKMADGKKPFIDFMVTFTDSEDNIIDTNSATAKATSLNDANNTISNTVSFDASSRVVLAATDSVASNFVFDSNVTQATKDIFIQYYPKIVDLIGPRMSTIPIKVHHEDLGGLIVGAAGGGEIWIGPAEATDKETIIHEMTHIFDDYDHLLHWSEGLAIVTSAILLDYKSADSILGQMSTNYLYEGTYGLENFNQYFLASYPTYNTSYTYGSNMVMKLFITQKDLIKNTRVYLVNNYRNGKAIGYEDLAYAFSQAAPVKIEGKSALDWLAEHYAFIPSISNGAVLTTTEPQFVLTVIHRVSEDYYGNNQTSSLGLTGGSGKGGTSVDVKVELFDMNSNKLAQCEKKIPYEGDAMFDSNCSQKFTNWDYQGIIKVRLTQNSIVYYQYITFVDGQKINYSQWNEEGTYMDAVRYTKDDALNSNKYNLVGTFGNSMATSVKIANLSTNWSTTAPITNNFFGLKDKQVYEEGNYVLTFSNSNAQTVETRYLAKTEGFYSLNPVMDIDNTCSIGAWSMETGSLPSGSKYENGIVYNTNYTNSTACLNMLYKNGLPIYRGTKNAITKYFEDLLPKVQYQFELRMTNGKGYASQTKTVIGPTSNPIFNIVAYALANGTITPSGITGVPSGTSKTFSIVAKPGYQVADVVVDGVSARAISTYTFNNVLTNHTITAYFKAITIVKYTITASVINSETISGSITPSGVRSVLPGKSQDYKIVAGQGYRIGEVKVNNEVVTVPASGIYSFTGVNSNRTITVSFVLARYIIAASSTLGGTISPSRSVSVDFGKIQRFIMTPNKDYKISDLKIDGKSVGPMADYSFNSVNAKHTIYAIFTPIVPLSSAQGKVVKIDNQPAVGATITIIKIGNSSILQTLTTDSSGSYKVSDLANGNYLANAKFKQCTRFWLFNLCKDVAGFVQFGASGVKDSSIQSITVK